MRLSRQTLCRHGWQERRSGRRLSLVGRMLDDLIGGEAASRGNYLPAADLGRRHQLARGAHAPNRQPVAADLRFGWHRLGNRRKPDDIRDQYGYVLPPYRAQRLVTHGQSEWRRAQLGAGNPALCRRLLHWSDVDLRLVRAAQRCPPFPHRPSGQRRCARGVVLNP